MTLIRAAAVIDASEAAVIRALGSGGTWRRTARALGGRLAGPGGPLRSGDVLSFAGSVPRLPGRTFTVTIDESGLPELSRTSRAAATVSLHTTATGAGTLTRLDYRSDGPALVTAIRRTRVLRAAEMLLGITTLIAREPLVVVAGVLVRTDEQGATTVLAARRAAGSSQAGQWELPGGKVEPEESEPAALLRELAEELDIRVRVDRRVGPDCDLGDGMVLRAWRAAIVDGTPVPQVHDELRWVTAEQAQTLQWLPADLTLVAAPETWAKLAK